MQGAWLRKQSGQAVVLVAIAVLALTAILALALDGGSIYLDKRQLQNAADSAALAGAERLMTVPPSYAGMHNQAVANLLQNLPGTTRAGTVCSSTCPIQKTIGPPGGNGVGTLDLGAGYHAELTAPTSYTYQVTIWHSHNAIGAGDGPERQLALCGRPASGQAAVRHLFELQYQRHARRNHHPGSRWLERE
jgi:Flp pilus assembly protein TadG